MTEATESSRTPSPAALARLAERFDDMLDQLEQAKPLARSVYQTDVFQLAEALMGSEDGLLMLYDRAGTFDKKHVFQGGPWADSSKLQPPLVAGSLKAAGVLPVVETLSELRLLRIAKGLASSEHITQEEAVAFLDEVMALNLEFVFPGDTEAERIEGGPHRDSNLRLFGLITRELGMASLRGNVVDEIEAICAQRPILTTRLRRMIHMAKRIPPLDAGAEDPVQVYHDAVSAPTPLSREHADLSDYRNVLRSAPPEDIEREAELFAASMMRTGLVAAQHAVLLRHLRSTRPELIPAALALNELGRAELDQNRDFVLQLIQVALLPTTCQSVYGFARMLERGLLSRQDVRAGLERLISLDLQSDVRRTLLSRRDKRDGVTANSILLAGALAMLGQPLGIGQGRNPTCQAARGLSLWSQHAPGYLLELLIVAARNGDVRIAFEGQAIHSSDLTINRRPLHQELDPVSLVLVPHLDSIYEAMMHRIALRTEDGHKWVNPALYGRWVPIGFASAFGDVTQTTVSDYEDFVRRFFATHHPAYNDGHSLMHPNPVGICVTNSHGEYLGPHAVSLQRIAEDPRGDLRAYFFNPNNEGRQNWGRGVNPSVTGHGEVEGESSLPFDHFVARLYAFHYNPYEEGDSYAVPDKVVANIETEARATWGRAFRWVG